MILKHCATVGVTVKQMDLFIIIKHNQKWNLQMNESNKPIPIIKDYQTKQKWNLKNPIHLMKSTRKRVNYRVANKYSYYKNKNKDFFNHVKNEIY